MKLPLDQRQTLLEVMAARFTQLADFRTFLMNETGRVLDTLATGTLENVQSGVVDKAEEQEWVVELVDALHGVVGPEAKARLETITLVETIRSGAFYDECYVDPYPLVNRKDLRAQLRSFSAAAGPRILHVKGNRYSGKSHALLHIRHVATTLGIPRAEIELRKWATGDEIRPYDLGLTIADAVPLPLPSHLDAKASRWSVNFMNWIGPQLDAARKRLWIVFDDFESEKLKYPLPDTVYDFVQLLAEKVAATPSMRLFLINYDKNLPSQLRPSIASESVPAITEQDLGLFFFDFYLNHAAADPPTAEQESIKRAQSVAARISADPALRLETMRDAVLEEVDKILGRGGP